MSIARATVHAINSRLSTVDTGGRFAPQWVADALDADKRDETEFRRRIFLGMGQQVCECGGITAPDATACSVCQRPHR